MRNVCCNFSSRGAGGSRAPSAVTSYSRLGTWSLVSRTPRLPPGPPGLLYRQVPGSPVVTPTNSFLPRSPPTHRLSLPLSSRTPPPSGLSVLHPGPFLPSPSLPPPLSLPSFGSFIPFLFSEVYVSRGSQRTMGVKTGERFRERVTSRPTP